jgi:hypothetical protein
MVTSRDIQNTIEKQRCSCNNPLKRDELVDTDRCGCGKPKKDMEALQADASEVAMVQDTETLEQDDVQEETLQEDTLQADDLQEDALQADSLNNQQRCACNKPPKKSSATKKFIADLLQDSEIKSFHTALSKEEACTFDNLVSDIFAIQAKIQRNLFTTDAAQKGMDQNMTQDEIARLNSRYHTLLQKIASRPNVAQKLTIRIDERITDLLK